MTTTKLKLLCEKYNIQLGFYKYPVHFLSGGNLSENEENYIYTKWRNTIIISKKDLQTVTS